MRDSVRLLVVEDNVVAAEGLRLVLADCGFDVKVIHAGRPTMGLLAHHRPDVLILDLTLPDIDGKVLAKMVRERWPDLPIIITTGHEQEESVVDDARSVFLRKPYPIESLLTAIGELITPPARRARSLDSPAD